MRCLVISFLLITFIPGAKVLASTTPTHDSSSNNCLMKANCLLDEALAFMKKHYYRRNRIQWDTLIANARLQLAASGNCSDYYDIITACFKQMNEGHSFLMPPNKAAVYNKEPGTLAAVPNLSLWVGEIHGELMDDGIAYITVPWVSTTDSFTCMRIADSIQHLIAKLDQGTVNNWIIDLRKNTGGNCWPMLAGIGPLLGNGVCGYFVSGNEKIAISYKDGTAFQGRNRRCQTSFPGYKTKSNKNNIIVLTGARTVSSGEIVALAFKGKEDTYFYGEPTAGYTTANATYMLSDNSMLVLTVCQEADRLGRLVEGKIIPDEHIVFNEKNDQAKSAAFMWMLNKKETEFSLGLK